MTVHNNCYDSNVPDGCCTSITSADINVHFGKLQPPWPHVFIFSQPIWHQVFISEKSREMSESDWSLSFTTHLTCSVCPVVITRHWAGSGSRERLSLASVGSTGALGKQNDCSGSQSSPPVLTAGCYIQRWMAICVLAWVCSLDLVSSENEEWSYFIKMVKERNKKIFLLFNDIYKHCGQPNGR